MFRNISYFLVSIAMSLFFFTACNQGEFSGGGSKKTADAKKSEKPGKDKKLGKEKDPEELGDPDDGNDDGESDTTDEVVNPDIGTDNSQNLNDSLIDILGGLLNTNSGTLTQDNDNQVTTAPGKAFRIGDGAAAATSCAEQVTPVGVTGKKYYFEFQVMKDQTQVQITFGVTCGIDYSDTNFVILQKGGTEIFKQNMSKNVSNQGMPTQTLDIGTYTILVESRTGTTDPVGNPDDFDDFLVGELKVNSNKPIKAGKIGSQ